MLFKICIAVAILSYLGCNLAVSCTHSSVEMRNMIVSGQCVVGRIASTLFYLPAWILKGMRVIILYIVK